MFFVLFCFVCCFGTVLVPFQEIATNRAVDIEGFTINGIAYFAIAQRKNFYMPPGQTCANVSFVVKYNAASNKFENFQNLTDSYRAQSIMHFEADFNVNLFFFFMCVCVFSIKKKNIKSII